MYQPQLSRLLRPPLHSQRLVCAIAGMAVTRSMTKKSWSDLNHDILLIVMMQLGIMDFFAFMATCKEWWSCARSNKEKFIGSRLPLEICFDTNFYCLRDYQGRKFKIVLPHFTDRLYFGCTCGYMILFGKETSDFWLVNPFKRHGLHFDGIPCWFYNDRIPDRALLVYSPLISEWVFVVTVRNSRRIWVCSAGKEACWDCLCTEFAIDDLHAFKGKIYILDCHGSHLYEMILHPYPMLKLLAMKNSPILVLPSEFVSSEFVSSGENLYVLGYTRKGPCRVHELDFDEMMWVSSEKAIGGHSFFLSRFKSNAAIKPGSGATFSTESDRLVHHFPPIKGQFGGPFSGRQLVLSP